MTKKAQLEKLEKSLKPESKQKEKLVLLACEAKPGMYFVDALDTDREEPIGKVYTEKELPLLEKKHKLFIVHFADVQLEASS